MEATHLENEFSPKKKEKMDKLYAKCILLGDEALAEGDRVLAERYYQQADHYFRVMSGLTTHTPPVCLPINESLSVDIEAALERSNFGKVSLPKRPQKKEASL